MNFKKFFSIFLKKFINKYALKGLKLGKKILKIIFNCSWPKMILSYYLALKLISLFLNNAKIFYLKIQRY